MRSNYKAPAQVHAAEHKEIDRVMTIERGYIAQSVTLAAAVSLNNRYGFGAGRIEQFAGLSYVSIGRYLQAPADKWPDMVRADCKKMRVDVDEGLLADRGRDTGFVTRPNPAAVTDEQKEAMDRIAADMFADGKRFVDPAKMYPPPGASPAPPLERLKMPGIRDVKYTKAKVGVERAFVVNCMITACAAVLHDDFGFGRGRLLGFAEEVARAVCGYFDEEPDCWPDLAEKDCARLGVKIKDGWIVGKDRRGKTGKAAPELSAVQRLYIHQSRTELLSDEESRIKHREWINNPQRDKQ